MTASELIEALELTGTGTAKLFAARGYIEKNKSADPREMVEALYENRLWPEGTREKANKLLDGATVESLQGVPPRDSQESREARQAQKIGEAVAEKIAAKQEEAQKHGVGKFEKADGTPGKPPIPRLGPAEIAVKLEEVKKEEKEKEEEKRSEDIKSGRQPDAARAFEAAKPVEPVKPVETARRDIRDTKDAHENMSEKPGKKPGRHEG